MVFTLQYLSSCLYVIFFKAASLFKRLLIKLVYERLHASFFVFKKQ